MSKEKITLLPGMSGLTRDLLGKMKEKYGDISLYSLDIMLTKKCNYRCWYCYAEAGPDKLPEFTMSEVKDIVNQALDMKVPIINIQGGEPLFWHPKDWTGQHGSAFFHLIQYIHDTYRRAGVSLNLVSFTNVSLVTEQKAKILYNLGIGLCCKLDSLNEKTQDDMLCTKGGFKRIMAGYEHLINVGYGKKDGPTISTNTVVTPLNYHEVPEVFRWSRSHGFQPFIIPAHVHGRLQEYGQDKGLDRTIGKKKNLSPLDMKHLFEGLSFIDRTEFGIEWKPLTPWIENKACSRHHGGIHIRADGIVVPCSEAPDYWALGDIRKKSLKDIIKSPKLSKFRNMYKEIRESKCSQNNCPMAEKELCYGCRTRAYDDSAYDDEGNYDRCKLDPETFFDGDPACWRGLNEHPKK